MDSNTKLENDFESRLIVNSKTRKSSVISEFFLVVVSNLTRFKKIFGTWADSLDNIFAAECFTDDKRILCDKGAGYCKKDSD